jgi:glycosyltransferase involved in cell wall biosynthesis
MLKTKLKVCHVITRMIVGGAQENTLLSAIGHLNKGHDVTLVTGPSPGPEGELLKTRDISGLKIVVNPHLVREINPYHDLTAYFSLKAFFKNNAFDVVHTHSSKAGVIGRLAADAAGIPFIAHTVHGQAFHKYEKPWKNFIYRQSEKIAARHCHRIFAVAQAMVDQCVIANIAAPSKYKVVYSGMELEPYLNSKPDCELRRKLGIPENSPVIGTVARLFPLKGYEDLMPAAKIVARKHPEVCFLIVGDGILKDKIMKEAEAAGMKFFFAGLVPPSDVHKYTALMDVLIHLSLREGLPRAVVQALASGKPAVAFRLDGTPEVVFDGKTGYLAEPGDVSTVADRLVKLIEDKDESVRMGAEGRKLVSELFDWKKMADILEGEYTRGKQNFPQRKI